ncbi:MAG: flagellar biosynthetic protein FliO [Oscillospiraceae bacterium]
MNETLGLVTPIFAILSVMLVLVVTFFGTKFLATKINRVAGSKYIKVIDRLFIAQDKSILIAKIGEKIMMLGVSGNHIEKISDIETSDLVDITPQFDSDTFKHLFQKSLKNQFGKHNSVESEVHDENRL